MKFGMFMQIKLPCIGVTEKVTEKQRGFFQNKKKIKMSQRRIQGSKKKHSKKITRKNVIIALSNVKDIKNIDIFFR